MHAQVKTLLDRRPLLGMMLSLLMLAAVAGCAGNGKDAMASRTQADIVDTAVAAGDFDTLVSAVKQAGLVETLKGEGPYTVFAPTDEAFARIPQDQLQALLNDREALTEVLTYHVVPGRVSAAEVIKRDSLPTVQGQSIQVATADGVQVDEARVLKTDIAASNGVIHVIDRVILPR